MPRIVVSCTDSWDQFFLFSTRLGEYRDFYEVDEETLLRLQKAKAEWDWMQDLLKELWNK